MSLPGRRLSVAIVANNASQRMGGEAILPYHYFRLLAERGLDVHLVVHDRCRAELEATLPHLVGRMHFTPDTTAQVVLWRLGERLPSRVAEWTEWCLSGAWNQRRQRRILREMAQAGRIDLVHQPTPVSPRRPSHVHSLGVPVVIGPMNGGMELPPAFRSMASPLEVALLRAGRPISGLVNRLIPGKERAAVLLVANERTRQALPPSVRRRAPVEVLPENGVDLSCAPGAATEPPETATFAYVGRLVDWKRVDLAMRAFASLRHRRPAGMVIIGDGPLRGQLEALADELGVRADVEFTGFVDQQEAAQRVRSSTALVLPSVRECGGAVVLEAMAVGRPVIATAWGGPDEYIDGSTGFRVTPSSPKALVQGFAEAMEMMADDPELVQAMGRAGRAKVEERYSWETKIDRVLDVYEHVLDRAGGGEADRGVHAPGRPLPDRRPKGRRRWTS